MSDDRFADATARLVAQDPSLTSLSLATRKHIPDAVLAALAASDHCRTAHLEMTAFDDGRCEALRAVGLPACLTALHLTRNAISSTGAAALAAALATTPELRSLHLGGNPLGAGLGPLGAAAAGLDVLNVSETQAGRGAPGILALAAGLAARRRDTGRTLAQLHCHGNGVDDAAAAALAPLLAAAGVREVYLGKNLVGDAGAAALAAVVGGADGPRKLSLLGNRVGDAGAASFAAAVARDPPLEQLNLSHNDLSDAGLLALIRAAPRNGTLRKLDVGVNRRCSDGAKRALRVLFDPSAVAARRFVAGALPLLLAHARDADGASGRRVRSLPRAVLLAILDLARPGPTFPRVS